MNGWIVDYGLWNMDYGWMTDIGHICTENDTKLLINQITKKEKE